MLREGGLEKYFDAVVNGEMVARRKPDPDVFLKSAELLGLPCCDCIIFEDSRSGLKATRAAGGKVTAIVTTYSLCDLEKMADYDMASEDFTQITVRSLSELWLQKES